MSDSPFAPGSVLDEVRPLLAPTTGETDLLADGTRRVVREEELYRFSWVIKYRNGIVRAQYERVGDAILQTLFGKIEKRGVERFTVYDLSVVAKVTECNVPEDAEVDFLMNCGLTVGGQIERIYTFGWKRSGGKGEYFHANPGYDPPRFAFGPSSFPGLQHWPVSH